MGPKTPRRAATTRNSRLRTRWCAASSTVSSGACGEIVEQLHPASVLDAGCGEGETLARLDGGSPGAGRGARHQLRRRSSSRRGASRPRRSERDPSTSCLRGSAPSSSSSASRCSSTCAIREPRSVSWPGSAPATVVISVPHEPWFRAGSLLRGQVRADAGQPSRAHQPLEPPDPAVAARAAVRGDQPGPLASLADRALPASLTVAAADASADDRLAIWGSSERGPARSRRTRTSIWPSNPRVSSWIPTTISSTPRKSSGRCPIAIAADLQDRQVDRDRHPDHGQRQPQPPEEVQGAVLVAADEGDGEQVEGAAQVALAAEARAAVAALAVVDRASPPPAIPAGRPASG